MKFFRFSLFLFFVPLLWATNSTGTTTIEKSLEEQLVRNATDPVKDAVLRSPVAYNQGSLIPAFPAVSKIRGKAKKQDSKAEIEEDVRQLINSLNHKKSGGAFNAKRGATGSNRAQFLVEIDTGAYTGDPYASGYRGLPESQVAPSNSYLGAITKSGRNGANRNTFGSYGSVDSAKGQSSLSRAGIGSNHGSDPYQSGYTEQQSVLGYGGYGQGYGSSQPEQAQSSYGSDGQAYGNQQSYAGTEEQASVYPVYGGTNQQPESYSNQVDTGSYAGYGATGTQPDYSVSGNQDAETGYHGGYGAQPEYGQYGVQEQGQDQKGYGANPVYEIPAVSNQPSATGNYGTATQQANYGQTAGYGQETQTDYSGYGASASSQNAGIETSGYDSSAYGANYGAPESTQQTSAGYGSTPYGNAGTTEYTKQPTTGYGSSAYGTPENTAANTGYSNAGYGASYSVSETAPQPQQSTGYGSSTGMDYSNYGQSTSAGGYPQTSSYVGQQSNSYGSTGYGNTGATDYQQANTYGQATDANTAGYTTQKANGYGSSYQQQTNYGNSYNTQRQGAETGYPTNTDYGTTEYSQTAQGYRYPSPTQAASTGYYSSTDVSSNYGNGYQAAATYPQQTGTYQTANYASNPTGYGSSSSPYSEASVYLPDSSRYNGQIDMSMGYGSLKNHTPPTKIKLANMVNRQKENELDGYKKTA